MKKTLSAAGEIEGFVKTQLCELCVYTPIARATGCFIALYIYLSLEHAFRPFELSRKVEIGHLHSLQLSSKGGDVVHLLVLDTTRTGLGMWRLSTSTGFT